MSTKDKKRRSPHVGLTLILTTIIFMTLSLGAMIYLANYFISEDIQVTAEENNHAITMQAAETAENKLASIRANTLLMLDLVNTTNTSGMLLKQTSSFFFERNPDVAAVIISGDKEFYNEGFFNSNEIENQAVQTFLEKNDDKIKRTENGEAFILNASPEFNIPLLAMMMPWREGGQNQAVTIFFDSSSIIQTFASGRRSLTFLVNESADLLVHPDFELVKSGINMSKLPLIGQMNNSKESNKEILFTDTDGKEYFGSFCKLSSGDVSVISLLDKEKALQALTFQTQKNIWLSLIILFADILIMWIVSKGIKSAYRKAWEAEQKPGGAKLGEEESSGKNS